MSEYVFNSASNERPNGGLHAARKLVVEFLETLAELDSRLDGPRRSLKLPSIAWELPMTEDQNGQAVSMGQLVDELYENGQTADLARFFGALESYSPASSQLSGEAVEAILRLQPLAPAEGYEEIFNAVDAAGIDALQCVVTGGTLVSLNHDRWNFDRAGAASGADIIMIDHASRPHHVDAILGRQIDGARGELTRQNFVAIRQKAFPRLTWGEDVAEQIQVFQPECIGLAFTRLAELNDIVQASVAAQAGQLDFTKVGLHWESEKTMAKYGNQRRHRSSRGVVETYEAHTWIDRGNRIHFTFSNESRTMEIGYVGHHLDTWRF